MRNDLENHMVVGEYYGAQDVYTTCGYCGEPIYDGETFYLINCAPMCADCVESMKREAEVLE